MARQLRTRADLELAVGFHTVSGVSLDGAHIGGRLLCYGGKFFNSSGSPLNAIGITIDRDMVCSDGFETVGEVQLMGAHITGHLVLNGGRFQNAGGPALSADGL